MRREGRTKERQEWRGQKEESLEIGGPGGQKHDNTGECGRRQGIYKAEK